MVLWTKFPVGVATDCCRRIPAASGDVGNIREFLSRTLDVRTGRWVIGMLAPAGPLFLLSLSRILPFVDEPPSLDTDDLEFRQVVVPALVEAVIAEVDVESFLDDDRLESEDGLRVTVQEFLLLPTIRKGSPQPIAFTESDRDEL